MKDLIKTITKIKILVRFSRFNRRRMHKFFPFYLLSKAAIEKLYISFHIYESQYIICFIGLICL